MTWKFQPDIDPTTPEIYTAMARMIPTPWGTYRTSPSNVTLGSATSTGSPVNGSSAMFRQTNGTTRWIVGTATKLWDSDSTGVTWTDRSGAAYSSGADKRWTFAMYGNIAIAVQLGNNPQAASSGGSFADLGGTPPKAALVCTQSNAVILANYNDGTSTPDGWWASDIGSHTTWTPAAGNEATNGRLLQTPGAITCLIAFGGRVIAFKDYSVYEGQYVGGSTIWNWRVLHPSIGTSNPFGAATNGQLLFFFGASGAYLYDGAQFKRVDQGIDKFLAVNPSSGAVGDVVWSPVERIFCIYVGSSFSAYCPDTDLWGYGSDQDPTFGAANTYPVQIPPGYKRRILVGLTTSFSVSEMSGTSYATVLSSVTTGWIGDDTKITEIRRVRPLFVPANDYSYNNGVGNTYPARLTHKTAATRAGTMASTSASPISMDTTRARFDTIESGCAARWHELTLEDTGGSASGLQGGMDLAGLDIDAVAVGED